MSTLGFKGGFFSKATSGGKRPLLTVTGLSAFYGELCALSDINFHVYPGEVFSIIGANGAGKSTLLRSLTGMMNRGKTAHISGSVDFQGRRLDRLSTEKIVDAGVTLVPEGRMLFSRLTVSENLRTGAYLPRCQANCVAKLEEMYDCFPRLGDRRNQVVSQMSGGEQQMVAIARALMSEPKVILFDEISLGLAPIVVDEIYGKVREINTRGVTCIVIEQDMTRALAVADQVMVMQEGRIVLEGKPSELSESDVTAAYFGSFSAQGGT